MDFDVVIVGASIAGCAAATLLAERGVRVLLVEKSRDATAYKKTCTHAIQAHAVPVLARLGVLAELEAAGAVPSGADLWTRWGFIGYDGPRAHGYNVRRETLDPILRERARGMAGVTYLAGHQVVGLSRDARGQVAGVVVRGADAEERTLSARLVVGADGRYSRVATLAEAKTRIVANERAMLFAYFRNVRMPRSNRSMMWFLEPDVGYAFPNDGDLVVLTCAVTKDALPAFREDLDASFRAFFRRCPGAPDLADAERVTEFRGMIEIPNVTREPIGAGFALVGDAATASDPIWGTGCGFALESAAWLADSVAQPLRDGAPLEAALKKYRRLRRAHDAHQEVIESYSRVRPYNALERLMFSAAVKDARLAEHLDRFGGRLIGPPEFVRPSMLLRAMWINLTRPARHAALAAPLSG